MKHWFSLALAGIMLAGSSCSKQEEGEVLQNEEASNGVREDVAGNAAADSAGEDDSTQDSNVEPPEEEGGGSLRDRLKVTEAPPVDDMPWSDALTLEERVANLEKTMASGKEPYVVDMHDFGGWEFDERQEQPFPAHILALDGKKFTIRGFMMPDIDFENIRKFHLVRSLFSCCFGAPPQLNEILRVTLADKDGMEYTYNTVEVTGTLYVVFEMEDGLVEDLFRLEGATYRIIDFDDPEAPDDFNADTDFGDMLPTGPSEF